MDSKMSYSNILTYFQYCTYHFSQIILLKQFIPKSGIRNREMEFQHVLTIDSSQYLRANIALYHVSSVIESFE